MPQESEKIIDVQNMYEIDYSKTKNPKAQIWRTKPYDNGANEVELIEVDIFLDAEGCIEYMAPRRIRKWLLTNSLTEALGPRTINMGNMPAKLTDDEERWIRRHVEFPH